MVVVVMEEETKKVSEEHREFEVNKREEVYIDHLTFHHRVSPLLWPPELARNEEKQREQ